MIFKVCLLLTIWVTLATAGILPYGPKYCHPKKITYDEYKKFKFPVSHQYDSHSYGHYPKTCRIVKYSYYTKGYCPKYPQHNGYGHNQGYGYDQGYNYGQPQHNYPAAGEYPAAGNAKDHGYTKLPDAGKNYGHNPGYGQNYYKKCQADGCIAYYYLVKTKCHGTVKLHNPYFYYHGSQCHYDGAKCGGYSACTCQTKICLEKVKVCYEYYGQYYEDEAEILHPCGCECFQSHYKPLKTWYYLALLKTLG